jgi:hypothetical protein
LRFDNFQKVWHFGSAENADLLFLCGAMDEMNYGKKGSCFVQFLVFVILFIILLIWVYKKNAALTF